MKSKFIEFAKFPIKGIIKCDTTVKEHLQMETYLKCSIFSHSSTKEIDRTISLLYFVNRVGLMCIDLLLNEEEAIIFEF